MTLLRRWLSRAWLTWIAGRDRPDAPPPAGAAEAAARANAERLAALGLLSAQVAHDLNNVLSLLGAQLERLEQRLAEMRRAGCCPERRTA